jgi:hypothetical protein
MVLPSMGVLNTNLPYKIYQKIKRMSELIVRIVYNRPTVNEEDHNILRRYRDLSGWTILL